MFQPKFELFSQNSLSLSLYIYIILFSFSLTISVSWSSLSFFTLFSMAASAIGLATSLLPSTSGKSTTAFSSAAFPSDRASVFYKRFKIRGPKCQAVFPSEKIDSRALTASPLELLKSSPANRYTKESSCIVVIGLNVHSTPVEIREKLAIPEAQCPQAITELCAMNHIEEAAVLSTCNRMEIYVVALSQHRGVKEVTEWMSKISGVSVSELSKHQFVLYNKEATQHLFEVAAGLNSLVLGEGQILAQVKQVVKVGQGVAGFDRKISGLFKHAITVGKRVRSETNIASGSVSVSSAAVELALMKLPESSFATARVLVIGAGKMGKLVIKHLVAKGCRNMVVVNRTKERVDAIHEELKDVEIIYKPFSEMQSCAAEADVVFTSTSSKTPFFTKEHVEMLPTVRSEIGRRLFIDISVPRNVEPSVSDLETAVIYNVDDLQEVVAANKEDRLRKAMEAEPIILEESKKFEAWKDSLETVPTIKRLKSHCERIRDAELNKCLSKIGDDISGKSKEAIYNLSTAIVKKILHGPMENLRCDDTRALNEILENMRALNRMFDLETETAVLEQKVQAKMEQKRR